MKKIFISFLIIISVVLLADFFSIIRLNYSYAFFISIIVFAVILIIKLIQVLFLNTTLLEKLLKENLQEHLNKLHQFQHLQKLC